VLVLVLPPNVNLTSVLLDTAPKEEVDEDMEGNNMEKWRQKCCTALALNITFE
jgi:hypothetical protein